MEKNVLINEASKNHGVKVLDKYYKKNIIPPEKKEYITKLENSVGPYMGIEAPNGETHFMLDAASQIATLGLGFNPLAFFGTAYHQESWTQTKNTKKFKKIRESFENLLLRELSWDNIATTLCHSGAEANEIALGYCYRRRINKHAKKVIAFEGSFHGRMQISLSSTWNKSKREPFEWDDYKTTFLPYPKISTDKINVPYPTSWSEKWESAKSIDFSAPEVEEACKIQQKEIEILLKTRDELLKGESFAIIIEPMQCEGGDQYATDRFYAGLLSLAKAFSVPVIFDEVQTGYHLGRKFFWHKQFELKNSQGEELSPDYIVCAKKAQIGLVISHCDEKTNEEFSTASFFRGQIHASALNQSKHIIKMIEEKWRKRLNQLIEKFPTFYSNPRGLGLAFAFDVEDSTKVMEIISKRFKFGLLYYPAGDKTLRFRLNTAFKDIDIDFLFDHLELITNEVYFQKVEEPKPIPFSAEIELKKIENTYLWHQTLCKNILKNKQATLQEITELFNLEKGEKLILINEQNFNLYESAIQEIQREVYEEKRQTSISIFKKITTEKDSVCIGIEKNNQLMAISFSGRINLFGDERGISSHEEFHNPNALYTADTTVLPALRGRDIGRDLKYSTILLGLAKGFNIFLGRNRQVHASKMFNINLSLGAYEYRYIKNDYLDELEYKDVIHYKIDYTKPEILTGENYNYLENSKTNFEVTKKSLSRLINKICLSNFVGDEFLENMNILFDQGPENLKQGYCASGQSEAVDKIVKSIWTKNKKSNRFLSFEGHYFGQGSFCARALSNNSDDSLFEFEKLPHPTRENSDEVLKSLEGLLKTKAFLGVFIEPTRQKFMDCVSINFLNKLRELTTKYDTPLVLNETASKYGVYSDSFYASSKMNCAPDAIMAYFGGQFSMIHINQNYFLKKPLMLISTWDGDEHSLGHAINELNSFKNENLSKIRSELTTKFESLLKKYQIQCFKVHDGVANFHGQIPQKLKQYYVNIEGRNIVSLSPEQMRSLIKLI